MERRTRIVATLGPATDVPGVLEDILDAGLDVARINFSHGTANEHRERIRRIRELSAHRQQPLAILADLPGPKLRVAIDQPMTLLKGQQVTLARVPGSAADISLTEPDALKDVAVGERVLFDDGRMQSRIQEIKADQLTLLVEMGGTLLPNKGINLPDTHLTISTITERDREALMIAAEMGADWLALSFVREGKIAEELRDCACAVGLNVPIMAKIERPEALERTSEIINAFDGIMVARGDLGVEIPLEKVPHVQKLLIDEARAAGKPVVTATDMLDSMRINPRPTRAEASDVANAVYDGTDALMLSGETAIGRFPVEAVRCMARIAKEAESHIEDNHWRAFDVPRGEIADHMTHMTCALASKVNADAIITPTNSGRTARLVARHRPKVAILAATPHTEIIRQISLVWGLIPVRMDAELDIGADRLEAAVQAAFRHGLVKAGARIVVLAGHPLEGGEGLPTVRVVKVGPDGNSIAP